MTDEEKEQQRTLGHQAAYRSMLLERARNLDEDDPLKAAGHLIAGRQDAIAALRGLCERLGIPNDWPDDLYLAEIIEKHVERYWRSGVEKERESCAKLCDQTAERLQATTDHCMQWAATAFKRQAEIIRARSKD